MPFLHTCAVVARSCASSAPSSRNSAGASAACRPWPVAASGAWSANTVKTASLPLLEGDEAPPSDTKLDLIFRDECPAADCASPARGKVVQTARRRHATPNTHTHTVPAQQPGPKPYTPILDKRRPIAERARWGPDWPGALDGMFLCASPVIPAPRTRPAVGAQLGGTGSMPVSRRATALSLWHGNRAVRRRSNRVGSTGGREEIGQGHSLPGSAAVPWADDAGRHWLGDDAEWRGVWRPEGEMRWKSGCMAGLQGGDQTYFIHGLGIVRPGAGARHRAGLFCCALGRLAVRSALDGSRAVGVEPTTEAWAAHLGDGRQSGERRSGSERRGERATPLPPCPLGRTVGPFSGRTPAAPRDLRAAAILTLFSPLPSSASPRLPKDHPSMTKTYGFRHQPLALWSRRSCSFRPRLFPPPTRACIRDLPEPASVRGTSSFRYLAGGPSSFLCAVCGGGGECPLPPLRRQAEEGAAAAAAAVSGTAPQTDQPDGEDDEEEDEQRALP
ncbi:hypothetical protein CDD83_8739 [Cordyceps sp. RAO-2017]|nr:hypothetical protein CDD83_8739 [Cordyceps sp. RAO-2017]